MSRSLKKGLYIDKNLIEKIQRLGPDNKNPIKTWSRSSTISPEMVGYYFDVHNGKNFIRIFVVEEMVGHKLGEFAPTRKFIKHGGKMAREQEKAPTSSSTAKPVSVNK